MLRTLLLSLALGAVSIAAHAQLINAAHLNTGLILEAMPESAVADSLLRQYQDSLATGFQALETEFNQRIQDLQDSTQLLTPRQTEARQNYLRGLQQQIQVYQQEGARMFEQRRGQYIQPLVVRVDAAIQQYAKANDVKIVFDTAVPGALVFVDDAKDITDEIIAILKSDSTAP